MRDFSTETWLVVDRGLFPGFAVRLAKDVGRVLYCCPDAGQFPQIQEGRLGEGLENVERVTNIFCKDFHNINLFCFCDVGFGWEQQHLVDLGKRVWGSGLGEVMEQDRAGMKRRMAEVKLPVSEYAVVTGMDALREFLQDPKHLNWWVKIDKYRGTFETFKNIGYRLIKPMLDRVQADIGETADTQVFICEAPIEPAVETGLDLYIADGNHPKLVMTGIEDKDAGYLAVVKPYAELPEPLTRFTDRMAPTFREFRYRGPFSNEIRIGRDKVPHMNDATCRLPSPPSELWMHLWKNLAEIVSATADGEIVEPDAAAKYGCQIVLKSDWAVDGPLPLEFPPAMRDRLAFHNLTYTDAGPMILPQSVGIPEIGAAIGMGTTPDAAYQQAAEAADSVKGFGVTACKSSFDAIQAKVRELGRYGLNFF